MPKGASPVSAFVAAPKGRKTPTARKPKAIAPVAEVAEAQTPAVAPPIPPMPSVASVTVADGDIISLVVTATGSGGGTLTAATIDFTPA